MPISSNLPEIRRALFGLGQTLNCRRKIGKGRVGDAILARVAEEIVHRSLSKQTDPGGKPWRRLSPSYLAWKIGRGYDPRKNVMTGEMLSYEEVLGETLVTDKVAAMTYGLDDFNRRKAEGAEEGGPGRPARPFYDAGKSGLDGVDEVIDAVIDEQIRTLG